MATAYAFSQVLPASSFPPKFFPGEQYSIDFEYSLLGAVVTGDTYTTPANAFPTNGFRIIDTQLIMVPLDTNATPTATISVGDSGSATRFINGAQAGNATATQVTRWINQAQGLTAGVVSSGVGYLYGTGTNPRLIVTVGGTVATAQTTGVIRLRVTFFCTDEN
jgi:hypothetical protein